MKKHILSCLGFVCLLSFVLSRVYSILSWKDTSGDYISTTAQIRYTPRNTVDVVFAGSSHVYSGVYPSVIWNEAGIASFDLSVSEQDKENNYYMLKNYLHRQSPKVVFVEMYALMFDEHGKDGDRYRNLVSLPISPEAYQLIKEAAELSERQSMLLKWPIVHTRYRELGKYDYRENPINRYRKGEVYADGIERSEINLSVLDVKEVTPLSEKNRQWIDRLYALSKEKGFELVFFMTPYAQNEEERMIENGAREYAKGLGIDFIDFLELAESLDFDVEEDMGDAWHCNLNGATKVSRYLAGYITANFSIGSHKDEKGYAEWDEDYKDYLHNLQRAGLRSAESEEECLLRLAENEGLTIVISLDGNTDTVLQYVRCFGLTPAECEAGGKWIYKNNKAEKILDNIPGMSTEYRLNRYDSFKIQYSEENHLINVMFNKDGVNVYENGLNVIVYDDLLEEYFGNYGIEN